MKLKKQPANPIPTPAQVKSVGWVRPKAVTHQSTVAESSANLIPAGSVLLVTRSGILRHTLPVAVTTVEFTVNQDLKALTHKADILPDYVAGIQSGHSPNLLKARHNCKQPGNLSASAL